MIPLLLCAETVKQPGFSVETLQIVEEKVGYKAGACVFLARFLDITRPIAYICNIQP